MANILTSSSILAKGYNHWGLITNNMQCRNCIRQSNGTLWCAIYPKTARLHLYKSTDDGFSWTLVRDDSHNVSSNRVQAGLSADGPFVWLTLNEEYDLLDVYMADTYAGPTHDIERRRYTITGIETDTPSQTTIVSNMDEGCFAIVENQKEARCVYILSGDITIRRLSHTSTSVGSATDDNINNIDKAFAAVMDENSIVHMLYTHTPSSTRYVKYTNYSVSDGWKFSQETIYNAGASATYKIGDHAIAFDGYGTLCALWTRANVSTELTEIMYSTSTDDGETWASATTLTRTDGHGNYIDEATSDPVGRTTLIGGSNGGFIISYVEDDSSAVPKTYCRLLTTSDGSTYTLGAETEIGANVDDTDHVVGLHFFHPNRAQLLDLSDPGLVRIAYCVGDGSSTSQDDEIPVQINQELLKESAYPSTLTPDSGSYTQDTADSSSILVKLNVLGGPNTNIDFYSEGMTGNYTTKFEAAFTKLGTTIRLKKYEPDADNQLSDQSAYGSPTESSCLAIFDPQSYSFPTPELTATNQTSYIELDVRKLYLPPNIHLSRSFVVNSGGHLKRTVWLAEFDGNEYELSQVVPRFLQNQICYYEVNAYVVGPSRNPFSRTVLPSET